MLAATLQIALALGYPLLVYALLGTVSPRALGLGLLALVALRLAFAAPRGLAAGARLAAASAAAMAAASATSLVWNDPRALLLAPALVNVALLAVFAASFGARETLIEVFAQAQVGALPDDERAYCRRVNAAWCAFFVANAAVICALALHGSREQWALYTGIVAYLGMGLVFAVEFLYRHWRFRRYVGLATDPFMRRIFPPAK
jgi:uncharacterized membrane protein